MCFAGTPAGCRAPPAARKACDRTTSADVAALGAECFRESRPFRALSASAPPSDSRVPSPALCGDAVLASVVEDVLHDDALEIFPALVADLGFHPQAQRRAVPDQKIPAIHSIGEQRLRMQRIEHVDAVDRV